MILVVDDNPEIRHLLIRWLRTGGYVVSDVDSGEAAMAFIKDNSPQCVILDISMPGMNGFDVLSAVRRETAYDAVRVVMYSAFAGDHKDRALQLGADAYIVKGATDWTQFQHVLGRLCGEVRPNEPPPGRAAGPNANG